MNRHDEITRMILAKNNFQYTQVIDRIVDYGIINYEDLSNELTDLDTEINDLGLQIEAIQNLLGVIRDALTYYLENVKMPTNSEFCQVLYGTNYGTIGLDDWMIVSKTGTPLYAYNGVGWDNDESITQWIEDFAFCYDLLTCPIGPDGTYGLQDMASKLLVARESVQKDRDKFEGITRLIPYGT